jgi:hypothetical protein
MRFDRADRTGRRKVPVARQRRKLTNASQPFIRMMGDVFVASAAAAVRRQVDNDG